MISWFDVFIIPLI